MFEIDLFNEEVIKFFEERKSKNNLDKIDRYSRAKLRDLFLIRLAKGELEKDKPTLTEIFNPVNSNETLELAIKRGEDKFRPLQDFMKEKTTRPKDSVIELLSILIDFEPRPFSEWRKLNYSKNEEVEIEETHEITTGVGIVQNENEFLNESVERSVSGGIKKIYDSKETSDSRQETSQRIIGQILTKKNRRLIYLSAGTIFTIGLIYVTYLINPKQCMLWNEDHYIEVDCAGQTNLLAVQKVPLDQERLNNFKKIMRPDTLSAKHVNKVWYSKIDHKVDFFTSSGFHPEHPDRSLKAATEHILTKYAGDSARIASQNNETR